MTPEEAAQCRKAELRRTRIVAVMVACLVAAIGSLFRGWRAWDEGYDSIVVGGWSECFGRLVFTLPICLGVVWLLRSRLQPKSKGMVCPKCERLRASDENRNCECGGKFEPLEEMKWMNGSHDLR